MDRPVRLRLILAAPVLGAVYYYLLIFLIGLNVRDTLAVVVDRNPS